MSTSRSKPRLHEQLNNIVLKNITLIPWRINWIDDDNGGLFANAKNGKLYTGLDFILLGIESKKKGYTSRWWGSLDDWANLDLSLNDSAVGTLLSTAVVVFNAECVEGKHVHKYLANEHLSRWGTNRYEKAQAFIESLNTQIHHTSNEAKFIQNLSYYLIVVPEREKFPDLASYYNCVFHELGHWVSYQLQFKHESETEELLAEIIAGYLAAFFQIPQCPDLLNCKVNLTKWKNAIKKDEYFISDTMEKVAKIIDFLVKRSVDHVKVQSSISRSGSHKR